MLPPYAVSVWDGRAAVARRRDLPDGGCSYELAANWEELEDAAVALVEDQGGALNWSGLYACSAELAERARWEE
jgi:hypothetical protein